MNTRLTELQIPVLTTLSTLSVAYQVVCIHYIRRMITYNNHRYSFGSNILSKYTYCTYQKGAYTPVSLSLIRYQSEANIVQLPWFVDTEYSALTSALKDDNNNVIKATAQELDRILRITSSTIYNDTKGLLLEILEETQAYQVSLVKDLKELMDTQKELVSSQQVSPTPVQCSPSLTLYRYQYRLQVPQ